MINKKRTVDQKVISESEYRKILHVAIIQLAKYHIQNVFMKLKTKTFYVTGDKSGGFMLMLVSTLTDVTHQSRGSVTGPGILLDAPCRQSPRPVCQTCSQHRHSRRAVRSLPHRQAAQDQGQSSKLGVQAWADFQKFVNA